jgi:hypothetical protein
MLFCTGALGFAGVLWQWGEATRQAARAAGMAVWRFTGGSHFRHGYNHQGTEHLVERVFDRMDGFFDAAPELRLT